MSAGAEEYFPPLQFPCRNCGGGDRGGDAIYHPFWELCRAKSFCHLYGAQGQRQVYLLPHATMNFVGLDLTTSDRKKKSLGKRYKVMIPPPPKNYKLEPSMKMLYMEFEDYESNWFNFFKNKTEAFWY
ncbi:hypothetical protein TNCV_1920841 [Trichonephila clavipes]|nr:hypothetical protein TNCV_1920841 [Trichonephila clavipes]